MTYTIGLTAPMNKLINNVCVIALEYASPCCPMTQSLRDRNTYKPPMTPNTAPDAPSAGLGLFIADSKLPVAPDTR